MPLFPQLLGLEKWVKNNMSAREKILRYYRASGEEDLAARLLDLAEQALRNRKYKTSEFLDPFGYSIAETIQAHYERIVLSSYGGYSRAERLKVAFSDCDFPASPDFNIIVLSTDWDTRYYQLNHRDVLGALMGVGIKREMIGDIIMQSAGCQIIMDASIGSFVIDNLQTIGAAPVQLKQIPAEEIITREEKVKEIRATVASLRLDAVAAAGFGTSRTKMAEDITSGKLKVNWQEVKSPSQSVKLNDILSMRGRGRVEISDIIGQTKKGRTSLLLKRFI